MKELTIPQIKRKRIQYLVFSAFTLLFCGLSFAFSIFVIPMSATFGLEKPAITLTFNILLIASCLGSVCGSQILIRAGVKVDFLLSAVFFMTGFVVTALFSHGNIVVLYIFFGVVFGLGSGFAYNGLIATTNLWFPDRIGFSSGTQLMCFGFGTLILGTLTSFLIPILGITTVFIGIGVVAFIILTFGAFFLSKPPANIAELMVPGAAEKKNEEDAYDPADEDAPLKSITFYSYWILASVIGAIGTTIVGSIVADSQLLGIAMGISTFLVGFQSTVNGLSRVVAGIIFDKTNAQVTTAINITAAVLAAGCVAIALGTGIQIFYYIGLFCCGVFYGGFPVITTSFVRKRYGMKRYPFNLSVGNCCVVFGSLINLAVVTIFGATNREMIFIAISVLAVIAALDSIYFCLRLKKDMKRLDGRRAEYATKALEEESK